MRKHSQIYGVMFRPVYFSQKERERGFSKHQFFTDSEFKYAFQKYVAAQYVVAECAKNYILHNWKKVKSWADLEISIVDNTGLETYYYNYKKRAGILKPKSKIISKTLHRLNLENRKLHNPVKKISKVVLDYSDGDLSLNINGKPHLWIDNESCIILADYIEKSLHKKSKK